MAPRSEIHGWGNYPKIKDANVKDVSGKVDANTFLKREGSIGIRGNGRSYGDSSLYPDVINGRGLGGFPELNEETAVLTCGAGLLLSDILEFSIPKGFFLPVTPGTKLVTLGGALAADIHGKNHHVDGNISAFVESFDLLTDGGSVVTCTPKNEHSELFWATCGGMGLTGVILKVSLRMKRISTAYMKVRSIKTQNLDEVVKLISETAHYTYSVAWIDCLKKGNKLGRSVLLVAEHAELDDLSEKQRKEPFLVSKKELLGVPFFLPSFTLNRLSMTVFNFFYYHKQRAREKETIVHYEPYFYPLDFVSNWNRIYGTKGFTQYQFVLPYDTSLEGMKAILARIAKSGQASFLSVLKMFGGERENNYLSFPMEGLNLAMDIKVNRGTLKLLEELDEMVLSYGGRVYLAKDARMSRETFEASYPEINRFKQVLGRHNAQQKFATLQSDRLGLTQGTVSKNKDLFMPNALILGANSDIAQACAREFLNRGWTLTLASRSLDPLQTFASELGSDHVSVVSFDAADFDSHKTFYDNLALKPELVICAFGYLPDQDEAERNWQESAKTINTNYAGAISILNIVALDFANKGAGSIIGISSVAGERGRQSNFIYGSTKAGFTSYLSGLRNKYSKQGVHVGTIKPGFVNTKMIKGLDSPGALTAETTQVAKAVYRNYTGKRSVTYTKGAWRLIMWIIRHVPEFIFKKLSL